MAVFQNPPSLGTNACLICGRDMSYGQGGKVSLRKMLVQHHCQYDVTLRMSDIKDGGQSVNRETS